MNILINGFKAKSGGGKNILVNFCKNLSLDQSLNNNYYLLLPCDQTIDYEFGPNITILKTARYLDVNIFAPILYLIYFNILIKKYKIDTILNFGDIIIPVKMVRQIYFFDWAYVLYPDLRIWSSMNKIDYLKRKLKVYLILRHIGLNKVIICQTDIVKERLAKYCEVDKLLVIPTPISEVFFKKTNQPIRQIKSKNIKLFYPSSYASHKNHDILIEVSKLIEFKKLPITIYITVADKDADKIIQYIYDSGVSNLVNLGTLQINQIYEHYSSSDALFFPSYLESYGFPLYEAMFLGKPIIASNLDFVRCACGDYIHYFDPFDVSSIIGALENYYVTHRSGKIDYSTRLESIPNWNQFYYKIKQLY
jgi:glycosyltransferase involved in cell wall biosynthesis